MSIGKVQKLHKNGLIEISKIIKKTLDIIHTIVYNNDCKEGVMPMSSKEMIKLLKKNGFIYVKSGRGSHRKFMNPETGKVTQVPYHSKEIPKGLEMEILKQAGLK